MCFDFNHQCNKALKIWRNRVSWFFDFINEGEALKIWLEILVFYSFVFIKIERDIKLP